MTVRAAIKNFCCGLGMVLLLTGCGGAAEPTPVPTLALPTSPPATTEPPPEPTAVPTVTPPAAPEAVPTSTVPSPTAVPSATAVPGATAVPPTATISANDPADYATIFVEPTDVLNVRSGPGVSFGIVGTIPPTATDVQITGNGHVVAGSTWVPVQRGAVSGWVNSRFLTGFVPDSEFCNDSSVTQLLERLETAVANQDDAALAQLIHPERGLRVRLLWYEAETNLDNNNLLSDPTSYNWGSAAGSGEAILGTPAQVLLPRLQTDFLAATEMACNEIFHGPTTGFVVLPDAYAPLNFISFYRPGTNEFDGLNWGTWVVGVEQWQGQYYLSTLVHYQWEP
ncbi:MAG: SH3 domain-containing protein [Anaerolineaceae bacterium]|nr:SH3 domain-containing protein [Anaerolineaceae bacterium]